MFVCYAHNKPLKVLNISFNVAVAFRRHYVMSYSDCYSMTLDTFKHLNSMTLCIGMGVSNYIFETMCVLYIYS